MFVLTSFLLVMNLAPYNDRLWAKQLPSNKTEVDIDCFCTSNWLWSPSNKARDDKKQEEMD